MEKIGFIGLGVMGESMARHILNAGYPLTIYNRTPSKGDNLIKEGAVWSNSPKEVAEKSDIVITIVGYPSDVREVYFSDQGLFEGARPGQLFIDMTTSSPTLAVEIIRKAQSLGLDSLDAPVSGGDIGAKNGTLSTMVGGFSDSFMRAKELLYTFSSSVERMGPGGSGQHAKMANQIMIAATMLGLNEMLEYADNAKLDLDQILDVVGAGAAGNWSLDNYGPRILGKDYSPGFFIKHFVKDLKIALDEADKMNLKLPMTEQAKKLYEKLVDQGYENLGIQAIAKLWWTDTSGI